jgi:hypothetical protein
MLAMPSRAQVNLPHAFQPNTPAKAGEVNDNFNTLKDAIESLQSIVVTQQQTITALQEQLAAVQNNSVLQLDGKLGFGTDAATGQPTARFTGVNVQIVNGTEQTALSNGVGNLIVGYNEKPGTRPFCSSGAAADEAACVLSLQNWAANQRTGSHNLIVGNGNAYTQFGGIVAGYGNAVSGLYSSVTGGQGNLVSGNYSIVSGGYFNVANGGVSSVSGGIDNFASGYVSSVSGGQYNKASGNYSSVSGGYNKKAQNGNGWTAGDLNDD